MDDFDIIIEIPEDCRTFDDWKKHGRHVVKGSKALWFAGVPVFHIDDTEQDCDYHYPSSRSVYDIDPRRGGEFDDRMPSDAGETVCDNDGREVGTRGYTQFNGGPWVAVTNHSDGSSTVHCGGPCGDLYVDEFGNT